MVAAAARRVRRENVRGVCTPARREGEARSREREKEKREFNRPRLHEREAVRQVAVVHLDVVPEEGEPPGGAPAADVVDADVVQELERWRTADTEKLVSG